MCTQVLTTNDLSQITILEEERVASVVADIDEETWIVPRGAFVKTPTDQVFSNTCFKGECHIQFNCNPRWGRAGLACVDHGQTDFHMLTCVHVQISSNYIPHVLLCPGLSVSKSVKLCSYLHITRITCCCVQV